MDKKQAKSILVERLRLIPEPILENSFSAPDSEELLATRPKYFLSQFSKISLPCGRARRPLLSSFQIDRLIDPNDLGESLIRRSGKVILIEHVATGGQGSIYSAIRRNGEREELVALKVVPDLENDAKARVIHEVTFLCDKSKRKHEFSEFVVKGIEHFHESGAIYLVMEFLNGKTLHNWINEMASAGRRPTLRQVLLIADSIMNGLEFLHANCIVHRDITPKNVVLAPKPKNKYFASIIDLGIAKNQRNAVTAPGVAIGTRRYLAPECYGNSDTADHRADIYSLAATMYFMLTSEPPSFSMCWDAEGSGKASHDIRHWKRTSPDWTRPRLHSIRSDVPESLADVIFEALEPNAGNRPRDVSEFRSRLQPFIADCEKVRRLQKLFPRLRRPFMQIVESVVKDTAVASNATENANTFVRSMRSQLERLKSGFTLPQTCPGHDSLMESCRSLVGRLETMLRNVESKMSRSKGKPPSEIQEVFWQELVEAQKFQPEILRLEHLLSRQTSMYC